MDIGNMISKLHGGKRCAREGWNGKGMYVFLVKAGWNYTDGAQDNFPNLPFIAMKTADDKVVPWLASQTDILAQDWVCTN
jgi:glutamyl/glutaminyl-tRNA synthetase